MTDHIETLVVGAGGLLGQAVQRQLVRLARPVRTARIPWRDPDAAVQALDLAAGTLLEPGSDWRVIWCAGAGVVGTSQAELDRENDILTRFLGRLGERSRSAGPGAFALASSAGGVYAGSSGTLFTEETEPRPISPYGEAKLAAEALVEEFAREAAIPAFVGRIANLYGPGQDLAKQQGLISQLCRAQIERRPISIYVSLDTAREYLFVDDAACMLVGGTERAVSLPRGATVTKILSAPTATTIAAILGELRRVSKRRPMVVAGSSPLARFQTRDLRFRSLVWTDIDALAATTLPVGIAATMDAIAAVARGSMR